MATLSVQNIAFSYDKSTVISDLSFRLKKPDVLAVTGASGSGKTTLLKLIYGEFDLEAGQIEYNGRPILGPKFNLITGPDFMKFVTQDIELMPFTSVAENIGKHLSNFDLETKNSRIDELLEVVELQTYKQVAVKSLSGGQKQRVALAQAMANEPEILLLDEPFSHIDNFKKHSLRRSLFKYLRAQNIGCIIASHDKEDVLPYADYMLVIDSGKVIVEGTPRELYAKPETATAASFFEEINEFTEAELGLGKNSHSTIILYARQLKPTAGKGIEVKVRQAYFMGNYFLVEAQFGNKTIFFHSKKEPKKDELVNLKILSDL